MGISVRTAGTEMAATPYYYIPEATAGRRGRRRDGLYEKARALEAAKYVMERVVAQEQGGGERRSPRLAEGGARGRSLLEGVCAEEVRALVWWRASTSMRCGLATLGSRVLVRSVPAVWPLIYLLTYLLTKSVA